MTLPGSGDIWGKFQFFTKLWTGKSGNFLEREYIYIYISFGWNNWSQLWDILWFLSKLWKEKWEQFWKFWKFFRQWKLGKVEAIFRKQGKLLSNWKNCLRNTVSQQVYQICRCWRRARTPDHTLRNTKLTMWDFSVWFIYVHAAELQANVEL